MKKYRIVEEQTIDKDGNFVSSKYFIQIDSWLWGWRYIAYTDYAGGSVNMEFNSKQEAEEYIDKKFYTTKTIIHDYENRI